ncbi:class I SAM-dependent methyltransferase [Bacillus aquiflavi]|uniref:Uncharacterized methyltransferase G4D64_11675 n=1 Tax=Bacillus aquiflavi TaxID=2672567 RepID=A0A6B3VZ08_9BACI|nr:class I SAM-dependent methyltransferase [Bacillus aquiflavi]MBA4537886.1 class I SAM-dependent methyltransferase [Bacillus aquiflavi]NEY82142.1 class I SAM-dependent methyltransferase [Bacillus aquiflavi]
MDLEFNQLFDEWASCYDETVLGKDREYEEVFAQYEQILTTVANKASGCVLEFGVGTGNLTKKLLTNGKTVYGVEPSKGMREIAQQKLPTAKIIQGDFLNFEIPETPIDTIVSTYAFHHLKDNEKGQALNKYRKILKNSGKIVFADTVFLNEAAKEQKIREAESNGFDRLVQDLKTEYYTTISTMRRLFEENKFSVSFVQMNPFVWLIEGKIM